MSNNRIFFATQRVDIAGSGNSYTPIHGLQSVGMTTNFNLRQAFELGQLAIYENIEGTPAVEMTLSKVLDGYPLIGHLATIDATAPDLAARINNTKANIQLGIWADTNQSTSVLLNSGNAGGNASNAIMRATNTYLSAWDFNFPLEDDAMENCTFVGNNKLWIGDTRLKNATDIATSNTFTMAGSFNNSDSPTGTLGHIALRQHWNFVNSRFPTNIAGISSSGTNDVKADGTYPAHLGTISVKADCKREELFELGHRVPYVRVPVYPIEVSTEIEMIAIAGDNVSESENGILSGATVSGCVADSGNLYNDTIRLELCEGTAIWLGNKNKLMSVNYSGGDAKGGNVKLKYSYVTYNTFTVVHPLDPNTSGASWYTNRVATYFVGG